jgi:hypothetical protein
MLDLRKSELYSTFLMSMLRDRASWFSDRSFWASAPIPTKTAALMKKLRVRPNTTNISLDISFFTERTLHLAKLRVRARQRIANCGHKM